jgi:hypothetical protein
MSANEPQEPQVTADAKVPAPFVLPKPTLTEAEFAERLAEIRRRRDDPEYVAYVERVYGAAEAYRREVNEQERRRLDDEERGSK